MPLLCLPIPDFSRANLCLVCPVIWHSRWELVQICWENFSQPLLAILYRLLAPCNASVSHPPPQKKTSPWWKKVGMQLRERNWLRYWFLAIRWNCASDNKTLRGAMRAPLQTKFLLMVPMRPLDPGWELSFDLWICKFYPNLDAKKSEGEIAHQIIKHCRHCRDSFHCTKHKSICQWLVWFGHCIYGFQTKKKYVHSRWDCI